MSVTSTPTSLEVLNSANHGIRVEFRLECDRYYHTIYGINGPDSVPLLESAEGTSDDLFPPSPPFSDLYQHNNTLFLTGATTAAHWSMSVETFQQFGSTQLIFDVACRLKKHNGTTGNLYRPVGSTFFKQVEQMVLAASPVNNTSCSVVIGPPTLCDSPGSLATCQGETDESTALQITPSQATPASFPATIQWQYAITWALN